jgi:hypothetical protein
MRTVRTFCTRVLVLRSVANVATHIILLVSSSMSTLCPHHHAQSAAKLKPLPIPSASLLMLQA